MNNDRVSIIIPAYNEAEAIEMVLKELLLETAKWEEEMVEIVVVNDGSSDETAKIVDNIEGVRLINHRRIKDRHQGSPWGYYCMVRCRWTA